MTTHRQFAALPWIETREGLHILLITSRDTGRWVLPKGWPMDGLDGPASALQEAWEEAGVKRARIDDKPIGHFDYDKMLDDGNALPLQVTVYIAEVLKLDDAYPEVADRTRKWATPKQAARLVDEPKLKKILNKICNYKG